MAALVQTIPSQQTTTITMLQTRPSSASGMLQTSHDQLPQFSSSSHASNSLQNLTQAVYRGTSSSVPTYSFTSTPSLTTTKLSVPQRPEHRSTASAPSIPTLNSQDMTSVRINGQSSGPTTPSEEISSFIRDDKTTTLNTTLTPSLTAPATAQNTKSSPDRYRRTPNRRSDSASTITTVTNITTPTTAAAAANKAAPVSPSASQRLSLHIPHFATMNNSMSSLSAGATPRVAADDMQVGRSSNSDLAKRYRRRSIHTIEVPEYNQQPIDLAKSLKLDTSRLGMAGTDKPHPLRSSPVVTIRPGSSHGRNGSSDSVSSSRSTPSRPASANKREASTTVSSENPTPATSSPADSSSLRLEQPKLVNIPPRNSSADAAKRITNPSPLSKTTMRSGESPVVSKDSFASAVSAALQQSSTKPTYAQIAQGPQRPATQGNVAPAAAAPAPAAAAAAATPAPAAPSPAAKHLAALNDKDNKRKPSKLRRAFSFGSAAELRKASAQTARLEVDPMEAEHERIAQRQEEGGIGRGIYSGQGGFFSGSTDNLSISSTASSASVMIRKMGRGMKKSTRSLVGLFRPKSIIGAPMSEPSIPEVSHAQASMVTVEAEREKVNVNADPHDRSGGGTAYPKLEQNSLDADRLGSFSTDSSAARRSIVGSERDRAEVLATIRKGILKRTTDSAASSPNLHPADGKSPGFGLPQIPHFNETPTSTAPSTPTDDAQGHRRTGSVALSGDDYFMSALKFSGDKSSTPGTPQSIVKRNATFSPRIQFHDTWPSAEYDRRGEIATCNRLTPMLAQQIKEELNTFKMEMEVHENSKIYTHFF